VARRHPELLAEEDAEPLVDVERLGGVATDVPEGDFAASFQGNLRVRHRPDTH
jgi:hypothetical protein